MFQKAENKKLYESVVVQVKQLVKEGKLKDGDLLPPEEELARSIGVSRPTVREGLRVLELYGLVETKRGIGTIVTSQGKNAFMATIAEQFGFIDANSYYVHELDILVQPAIAKRVALRATKEDIEKLRQVLDSMKESIDKKEMNPEVRFKFHSTLAGILKNPVLDAVSEMMHDFHDRESSIILKLPGRYEATYKEHCKIFEAICLGDGEKAFRAMEKHIENIGKTYERIERIRKE